MPLLTREIDCFPPSLFEGLATETSTDAKWWVAYTRSRREKDLMRKLAVGETAFYCPIIGKRNRAPSGRIRESFVPLFPGYVFIHGSEDDRLRTLTTNCVAWINPVVEQQRLTRELTQVHRLISADLPLTAEAKVEAGTAVRVMAGPLRGCEGFVIERRGRRRLLVAVDLLQQGASVDFDECDVQPL